MFDKKLYSVKCLSYSFEGTSVHFQTSLQLGVLCDLDRSCPLPSVPTVSPLLPAPSLAPLLQVFSNEGQFKFRFGVRGRSPGQLQRPTGVAVDTNGDIIVADYDNRWVSIFSPEGKFKVRGLLSLHPWWPAEVTILEPPGGQDLD